MTGEDFCFSSFPIRTNVSNRNTICAGVALKAYSLLKLHLSFVTWQAMANNSSVCQRPNTKYSCVNCAVIICNVCLVPAQKQELGDNKKHCCFTSHAKSQTTSASKNN